MSETKIGEILVPLDGSETAEWALPVALGIARPAGARIRLVRCLSSLARAFPDIPAAGYLEEWETRQHAEEAGYMGGLAARLKEQGFDAVAETAEGDPTHAVVEAAANADLVVLTAHGWSGPEQKWLGHVADGVVHHIRKPVMVVRGQDGVRPEELTGESGIRRILVPTDGSEAARSAETEAALLARLLGASITLFRAIPAPSGPSSPYIPHAAALDRAIAETRETDAYHYLEGRQAELQGVDVTIMARDTYNVAREILAAASEVDADLVAVGTHRDSRLARIVLGSVADKVVRGTRIPVLIAHAA
jgi:nucleotide-binding universal stress UspA family protein